MLRLAIRQLIAPTTFCFLLASGAQGADVPERWKSSWPSTNFSRIAVDPAEIFSGGVPRDGIPAISDPVLKPVATETTLGGREPLMVVEIEGQQARAYPIRYLIWHEIVNDEVAGTPIAVTFCPLCNSALVFDRRLTIDGKSTVLEFGVSGLLRHSDMIMYDRQTESWWQQFTGEAIVGALTGRELRQLPALMESWDSFRARHPEGLVMAQPTTHNRPYGRNPYAGYDTGIPFLYRGELPPNGMYPLARVVRVGNRAWPLQRLREARRIEEAGYVLTWESGQASALSVAEIAEGAEVGNVRVTDMAGDAVVHEVVFAFAFHAFEPDGIWMQGPD